MKSFSACGLGAVLLSSAALTWSQAGQASSAQQTNTSPPTSPAASVGLFAYPKNEQSSQKQLQDESDCFGAARQQTGIDPANPQAANSAQADEGGSGSKAGGAGKGAAKGAAGGAAIGAITGDAGTGAAVGATVGGVRGRRTKKKAEKEEQEKAKSAAQKQQQQQLDTFRRSMSACLDARGYSVK